TSDWMAWPSRAASGVLPITMLTFTGVATPAWASRALAAAGSCLGHAWAASEVNGLAGLIGPQAGAYLALNTTWLMAARSMLISKAWRTRLSFDIGLASLAPSGLPGLPTPSTLPMLMVMPWYPSESEVSSASFGSADSASTSVAATTSSTCASP